MKLTQSLGFAVISALTFVPATAGAQNAAKERWFEIEVILFSQLGDKSALKEDFDVKLPEVKLNPPRYLLTKHINPNLEATKALIPTCGNEYPTPYVDRASILETSFTVSDVETINNRPLTNDEVFEFQQRDQEIISADESELNYSSSLSGEGYEKVESIDDLFAQQTPSANDIVSDEAFVSSLTIEEQNELLAQVNQAQRFFDEQQFSYQFSIPEDICLLPDTVLSQLSQDVPHFNADYFALENMPSTIMRYEDIYSSQPYLVNDVSLALHDIVLQLKRSKNFRPLLHTAWRQPAINKRRSRPMRLFAGENLAYAHEKAMQAYTQEKADLMASVEQEATAQSLIDELIAGQSSIETSLPTVDKVHPFSEVINTLQQGDISPQDALAELTVDDSSDPLAQLVMPVAPEVDWTIDGLFNVHLNHYLYITAEFNVANSSLAAHETALLSDPEHQIKAVRFSQNRRVISKEIHYFDHPYMGMIVQIRRYKVPTKPVDSEE